MHTKRALLGTLATIATTGLLLLGLPTIAQAYNEPDISADVTPGVTSVTVNLATVNYGGAPTGGWIDVLSGGNCSDGTYCYSTVQQEITLTGNYNGTYTIGGLKANTKYEVWLYAYGDLPTWTFKGYTQTLTDPHAAPTHTPTVHITYSNLKTTVHIPSEHETKGVKFNLYAHYKGAWHRVEHKVADNKTYTINHLPTGTIYFAVTALRANGESNKTANSTSYLRDWKAPTAPSYSSGGIKGYIYPDHQTTYWKAAKPGSGHITKYVLYAAIQNGPIVAKHTYKANVRKGTINGLTQGTTYIFTLYAYNSHGKKTIYNQLIGTYR